MQKNTFDRTQTQYERKLARQKQLDMMEAAASGRPFEVIPVTNEEASLQSRASSGSHAPEGAIESARRFLWDEEEEDVAMIATKTAPTLGMISVSTYDSYDANQSVGLMRTSTHSAAIVSNNNNNAKKANSSFGFGSRMANTIMGTFSRSRYDEEDGGVINIAPRRGKHSYSENDAHAREADEYIDHKGGIRRGGALASISDCCLGLMHSVVGVFVMLCEYFSRCLAGRNSKICALIVCGFMGLGLLIFAIVALVTRAKGGGDATASDSSSSTLPDIVDLARYNEIRGIILFSEFTSSETLDLEGTAQNYALRWLTDDDPAKVPIDDDALLERYALATFYFSTFVFAEMVDAEQGVSVAGGWTFADHWMSEKGICMWYGISCTPHLKEGVEEVHYNENSNVLRFNLTNNYVRGFIPSEISALENLVSLDLGDNSLQGKIPTSISTMRELREIYLQDNLLSGTIITELGKLRTLRDLFIGTNKFIGTIPNELGQLTELRALGLDENLLTGNIPYIWTCSKLLILYLDDNQLTGTISPNLNALVNAVDVRLRKNALTGTIPQEIHDLSHLELLYLDDNRLTGSIPATWDLMPRLQEIQVYKNELTGVLPDSISSLRDLKVLYADNNKLKGTIPTSYGNLGDLETFYAFNNELSGTIPSELGGMKNLLELNLYNNKLNGHLPSELGGCYRLIKLEVQDNELTGQVPSEVGGIQSLQKLALYRNKLTGSMPSTVCDANENFQLGFIGADCNTNKGGSLSCSCCHACYP